MDAHAVPQEELLPIKEPDETTNTFTLSELAFYDGVREPLAPLYLAIRGRVYDVTKGSTFYAPGRSYHPFLGKDSTRAYGTGCLKPECLISSTVGLTLSQLKEVDRWIPNHNHHHFRIIMKKNET
jgi:predicted heme/steroid binding protein